MKSCQFPVAGNINIQFARLIFFRHVTPKKSLAMPLYYTLYTKKNFVWKSVKILTKAEAATGGVL